MPHSLGYADRVVLVVFLEKKKVRKLVCVETGLGFDEMISLLWNFSSPKKLGRCICNWSCHIAPGGVDLG